MELSHIQKLYQDFWNEVQKAVWHCVAYKSDIHRVNGKKPVLHIGWTGSDVFLSARDSLQYKSGALVWHLSLLQDVMVSSAKKAEDSFFDTGENIHVRFNAMHNITYVFDDIIYASISLFDYLSELIYVAHFPDKRGNKMWSTLAIKNYRHLDDKRLADLIIETNKEWVKPLSRYRGHIIHNKAEMGGVGMSFSFEDEGIKFIHEYDLPEKLINTVDAINKNHDLMSGALTIAEITLSRALAIIRLIGSYEYKLMRTSVLEQSKW